MKSLPACARVSVTPSLAAQLAAAVQTLPAYRNEDYYAPKRQTEILTSLRALCSQQLDSIIGQIRVRLRRPPFAVVVSGLYFDEPNRLLVALNRALGQLVAKPLNKPRAQLLHYIVPRADLRDSVGAYTEQQHTDGADWPEPPEWMSLLCVRPDRRGGGRSRLIDAATVKRLLRAHAGSEVVELLERQPVPWQLAEHVGGGVAWRRVFESDRIRWRRYTIDFALQRRDVHVEPRLTRALDAMTEVLADSRHALDFLLERGDWLLSDNLRTLHARTPIDSEEDCERLLIRSWIRQSAND